MLYGSKEITMDDYLDYRLREGVGPERCDVIWAARGLYDAYQVLVHINT